MTNKYKTLEEELAGMNFLEKRMWFNKRFNHVLKREAPCANKQADPTVGQAPPFGLQPLLDEISHHEHVILQHEEDMFDSWYKVLNIMAEKITGDPEFVEKHLRKKFDDEAAIFEQSENEENARIQTEIDKLYPRRK